MAGFKNFTMIEFRAKFETVQERVARYASCTGQERRVVCVLSGVVVGVFILTIVLSMVTIRESNVTREEFESAYMKDSTLHILEKEGEVFMEMDSFEEGLVIVKLGGHLYNVVPGFITISNMTMHLKTIRAGDVQWKNNNIFELNQHIFSKVIISKEIPVPSYPEPGIYVKSYGYGINLIDVYYSSNDLVGMKLTGSVFVPSGKTSFTINMETEEVRVQHASQGFQGPYWSEDYEMVNITKYGFEMDTHQNSYDDTVYHHISRFVPIIII
eukprot:GFUD01005485.1.p1 GENE.GFUD01005485.1~~GFUD01005485.1.p1  ORF type:complete len:270 (+),score=62.97 GFUD01005485.1:41-850(+)